MTSKETEAKFLVQDSSLWWILASLTSLGPFRFFQEKREDQVNVYWDTPDGRLKKAHAALKLRTIGPHRELIFKREIAYRGGVSQRLEITCPIRGRTSRGLTFAVSARGSRTRRLGAPALDLEPVRRARQITGTRPWVRVLTLKTLRRKRIFAYQGKRIEMDLDHVSVLQDNRRRAAYQEVELEKLDAPEPAFHWALADLRRRFGGSLKASRLSKYEIGQRLSRRRGR